MVEEELRPIAHQETLMAAENWALSFRWRFLSRRSRKANYYIAMRR
jgi:hypothetical protein